MAKRNPRATIKGRHDSSHLSAETIIGEYVIPSADGCWMWTGPVHAMGYGCHPAIDTYVHRFVYETLVAEIPPGHVVHHRCEVKLCVRPDHLEALPSSEHSSLHLRHRRTVEAERPQLLRAAMWMADRLDN